MPTMQRGIAGGFPTPPQETAIAVETLMPSMGAEDAVRQASAAFYAALNAFLSGDLGPMRAIWAHSPEATTLHPIGGRQVGWDEVWSGWEQAGGVFSTGQVR